MISDLMYMEIDPFDKLIKLPHDLKVTSYYQLGDLYALTNDDLLLEEYNVRVYYRDEIYTDRLIAFNYYDKNYLPVYYLDFVESKIEHFPRPLFTFEQTAQTLNSSWIPWVMRELTPALLDILEDKFSYNMIGISNIPKQGRKAGSALENGK